MLLAWSRIPSGLSYAPSRLPFFLHFDDDDDDDDDDDNDDGG